LCSSVFLHYWLFSWEDRLQPSPYYWVLGFGDNEFLQGWIWILSFPTGYNQIDQVRLWIGIAFNNQFLVKCISIHVSP
jgi:hypothetical protein